MNKEVYYELMAICYDYNDIMNSLYKLNTTNEDELNKICQDIKSKLIETKILDSSDVLDIITTASECNCRYFKSYWTLFKKIYKNSTREVLPGSTVFSYFLNKEFGVDLNFIDMDRIKEYNIQNSSIEVHEENTIYRAIMDDDVKSFIQFTEKDGFNKNQEL